MILCYLVATPVVSSADSVTAYQGSLEKSFGDLGRLGYDGVELMTLNPGKLDWNEVKETAEKNGLSVILVCTGEIFGQLGLSYTNPREEIRKELDEAALMRLLRESSLRMVWRITFHMKEALSPWQDPQIRTAQAPSSSSYSRTAPIWTDSTQLSDM